MQYSAVATAAATTAILPNFFLSLILLIGLCVCIFSVSLLVRRHYVILDACYSLLRSLSWFTCFGGQVLPSDLLSMRVLYMHGVVNDNNFSHLIFNDRRWATHLRVHINKRKIGQISFIFSCQSSKLPKKKELEIDLFDFLWRTRKKWEKFESEMKKKIFSKYSYSTGGSKS